MSYQALPYTYGVLDVTEINNLTGMQEGDTVYNRDWDIMEIYNGSVWTNDISIVLPLAASVTMVPGDGVAITPGSGSVQCRLSISTDADFFWGICLRGGSSTNDPIVVAFMGKVDAKLNGAVTRGQALELDSSGGFVAYTGGGAPYTMGQALESAGSGVRTIALQTIEGN